MDQNIRWAWFFRYEIISLKMDEHGMFLIEQITTLSFLTPLKWLFWGPSNTPAIQLHSPFHWCLRISSLPHCTKLICLKLCKSWGQTYFNYKPQLVLDCNSFWSMNQYPDSKFSQKFSINYASCLSLYEKHSLQIHVSGPVELQIAFPTVGQGSHPLFPTLGLTLRIVTPSISGLPNVRGCGVSLEGVPFPTGPRIRVNSTLLGTVPYPPPKWHTFELMIFLFKLVTKQCAWPRNRFLIKRFIHGTFDKSIKVSSDKKHEILLGKWQDPENGMTQYTVPQTNITPWKRMVTNITPWKRMVTNITPENGCLE